ncbi:MAG: alpha/beta hydrolase [Clostridia bacterium]|nr:alpha/beta hydrolase [Clostridia bacterium]
MFFDRVDLYAYFGLERKTNAQGYLNVYIPDAPEYKNRVRPAMLVLAGGGYSFTSSREKECVALRYVAEGFAAFTLDYSVAPIRFPAQLIEGAMAMAYIRENTQKLRVIEDKVAVIGFSAGGHLAGMLGTMFNRAEIKTALGQKATLVRPDAMILAYPVITGGEKAHGGSFYNLFGGDDYDMRAELSIEKNVTANSSPAFIWTTMDDDHVPSENSLLMATALKAADVPFELHMFESGHHGLSLATEETGSVNKAVQKWFALSVTWLTARGFVLHD